MPNLTPKGEVVGKTAFRQVHVFPGATGAYQAADCVGPVLTFPDVVRAKSVGAVLLNVTVADRDDQKAALDIVFMHTDIPSSDAPDNAAFAIVDSDLDNVLAVVGISTGDYDDLGGSSVATVKAPIVLASNGSSRSIYAHVITRGTPTYTTDGLTIGLGISED